MALSIYAFLWFNMSFRLLQCVIDVTYKTIHKHVERFPEALDAPSLDPLEPVEIGEMYISAGLKGRQRDQRYIPTVSLKTGVGL
jgi:hypothetical protein